MGNKMAETNKSKRRLLGEILLSGGLISQEQLEKALKIQQKTGKKLGEIFLNQGIVTEEQIIKVLEMQLGIRSLDLSRFQIDNEASTMIPENICRKYTLIGVQITNGQLLVAMKDPLDYYAIEDVRFIVPIPMQVAIASEKDIMRVIDHVFSKNAAEKALMDFIMKNARTLEKKPEREYISDIEVSSAPIVRFINSIIENAVRNNASDIHIEPEENSVRIRTRIDGLLTETMRTEKEALNSIITRIKIMANMDISEKRLPQDGRFGYFIDKRSIDLRVSTLPTIYGEKVVMRILDRANFVVSKEKLGLSQYDEELFEKMIRNPHGIILVTGPTGSGKTSTLYAMMSQLNDSNKNIITIEDPVEYNLQGINQVQLNVKAGLTFASGLRSILRQDPDIIMVGEIRDSETAEIATRSALTGHLVLSTLHTNDAPSAIARLIDMNIEPYLISSSVIGVVAQRLIRKICSFCKVEYAVDERERRILGIGNENRKLLYKATGCPACNGTGFKGRTAVFEIMVVDKKLRELIDRKASTDEIRNEAIANGMNTLWESGKRLVLDGVTSVEELVRVMYTY
jgi:type IV pilus assembly protein PilB